MYTTYLTNFGYSTYTGDDLQAAKGAALRAGFECDIYEHNQLILSYSPITGWRGHVDCCFTPYSGPSSTAVAE